MRYAIGWLINTRMTSGSVATRRLKLSALGRYFIPNLLLADTPLRCAPSGQPLEFVHRVDDVHAALEASSAECNLNHLSPVRGQFHAVCYTRALRVYWHMVHSKKSVHTWRVLPALTGRTRLI